MTHEDEMRPDVGSTRDEMLVGRVEMPNVTALQDEQDDPVDACNDEVKGERSPHMAVLSPYCMAMVAMFAVCRDIKGIEQCSNNHKEPGDDCQDLVGYQRRFAELGTFRKWVVCRAMSSAS